MAHAQILAREEKVVRTMYYIIWTQSANYFDHFAINFVCCVQEIIGLIYIICIALKNHTKLPRTKIKISTKTKKKKLNWFAEIFELVPTKKVKRMPEWS